MDLDAAQYLIPLSVDELKILRLYKIKFAEETRYPSLYDLMNEHYQQEGFSWANVRVSSATEANLIAFSSSGWIDDYYPSYVGYDAKGNIVSVVTDFLVMPEPYDNEID